MPTLDLLFFPGCPHVPAAREQLQRALDACALEARWSEHDVTDPATPAPLRRFGSPTILIDGRDVTGQPPGDATACRVYLGSDRPGAPPLALLVQALRAAYSV